MKTERTATFLMANLGSEVSRLFSAQNSGEKDKGLGAAARAHEILDELLARPEMKERGGEINILYDIIEDAFSDTPRYPLRKEELENYFMPFALRTMTS